MLKNSYFKKYATIVMRKEYVLFQPIGTQSIYSFFWAETVQTAKGKAQKKLEALPPGEWWLVDTASGELITALNNKLKR